MAKQRFNFDSFVLTTGQMIIFIFASIISCVINLLFIGNLSETTMTVAGVSISPSVIMVSIAICLELAKLFSITMRNTLEELNRKIKKEYRSKSIKRIANIWLFTYLFYAVLAITSAVNFSLGNLGKEELQNNYNIQIISQYKDTFEENFKSLKVLNDELSSLDNDRFAELKNTQKFINDEYFKYEQEYNNVSQNFDYYNSTYPNGYWGNIKDLTDDKIISVVLYREKVKRELGLVNGWNRKTSLKSVIENKYSSNSVNKRFADKEKSLKSQIAEIEKKNKDLEKKEITLTVISANGEQSKKKIEVGTYENICQLLKEEKLNQNVNAGTQISLRLASEAILKFLHKNGDITDFLRIGFLLLLAILVEITIFQTSPKVKLDRKSMYQFSRFLPNDFDINSFIVELDKELEMYGFDRDNKKEESQNSSIEIKETSGEDFKKYNWIKEHSKSLFKYEETVTPKKVSDEKETEKPVDKVESTPQEEKKELQNEETIKKENAEPKEVFELFTITPEKKDIVEKNNAEKIVESFVSIPKKDTTSKEEFKNVAVDITENLDLKKAQEAIKEVPLDKPSSIDVQDFAGKSSSEPFESLASQMARAVKSYIPTSGEWEELTREVPMDKPDFSIVQKLSGSRLIEVNPEVKKETKTEIKAESRPVEVPKKDSEDIEIVNGKLSRNDTDKKEPKRKSVRKRNIKKETIEEKKVEEKEEPATPIRVIKAEEQPIIEKTQNSDGADKEIHSYRLGKTTEKVKQKFMDFIDALYSDCSYNKRQMKYVFTDYVMSDKYIDISAKNKITILDRLKSIKSEYRKNQIPIIEEDNGILYSRFDKDFLKRYLTETV